MTITRRNFLTAATVSAAALAVAACGGGSGASDAAVVTPPVGGPPPAPPPPATTYSVTVSWSVPLLNTDGTSLTDVTGHRIYYGTSPANLAQSILVPGVSVTSQVITGLAPGTYYFAVATLNSMGVASDPSNPASKTVP